MTTSTTMTIESSRALHSRAYGISRLDKPKAIGEVKVKM